MWPYLSRKHNKENTHGQPIQAGKILEVFRILSPPVEVTKLAADKSNLRPPQPTPFEYLVQHAYVRASNRLNLFNLTCSQDESPFNHRIYSIL
jgi:hypothetical protein